MPPKIPKLAKKTARLSKQFVAALERSNYKETQKLLQNHPQLLNEPITDHEGSWPPLRFAVNRSNEKIVTLLLDRGATVDELDAREQTALFDALLESKVDITHTLLQHRANPNQQDIYGFTPLYYVIKHPNPDDQRKFIQLLLMHGANPHLGVGPGQITPISCALALGRHDLVTRLEPSSIQKESTASPVTFDDIFQKLVVAFDNRTVEPFKQCIRQATHLIKDLGDLLSYVASLDTHPYLFVTTLLKQGVPLEPIQEGADSALIQAVVRRDYSLQRLLLHCEADPNWPGQAGNTALMQAIKQGDIASVELILSLSLHLIDPAVHCDDQGDLMSLISRQPHKIRQPIEDKLSKYIRNETNPPDKLPEIEQAVAENNFQQFKQLLDSHPNLIQRSQAQHGNRLLMAAVKNQANPMLKKLLQHGADPRLTDPEGRTPLHWAANKKLLAITQTLLNDHRTQLACLDKWGNSALWQAGIQGHPAIIQKFLEDPQRGFEANPQLGQDELYRALTAPHWRAMESFLDGGVDPDQINATGKSVWQEAAQNPNPQIMQLLLRYDRLELQDRLWWAFKQKDCPFFQQLLQHEGISLEQANPQGLV